MSEQRREKVEKEAGPSMGLQSQRSPHLIPVSGQSPGYHPGSDWRTDESRGTLGEVER